MLESVRLRPVRVYFWSKGSGRAQCQPGPKTSDSPWSVWLTRSLPRRATRPCSSGSTRKQPGEQVEDDQDDHEHAKEIEAGLQSADQGLLGGIDPGVAEGLFDLAGVVRVGAHQFSLPGCGCISTGGLTNGANSGESWSMKMVVF